VEIQESWVIPGFLGEQRQDVLDYVLSQEQNFSPATVSLGATRSVIEGVRKARVVESLGDFEGAFVDRIRQLVQPAIVQLRHKMFPFGHIELQIAASNDGDYFRLHQDGGPDATREITFVYFLHGEPRPFLGGELSIRASTVTPRGDTLVLFPSCSVHEVLPVHVPSRAFADSRFTVNGWIHRKQA
jgi:Rps23 Pro-64 3,4-dihydroxylase Tpa1-like proline 4-hydroxylase